MISLLKGVSNLCHLAAVISDCQVALQQVKEAVRSPAQTTRSSFASTTASLSLSICGESAFPPVCRDQSFKVSFLYQSCDGRLTPSTSTASFGTLSPSTAVSHLLLPHVYRSLTFSLDSTASPTRRRRVFQRVQDRDRMPFKIELLRLPPPPVSQRSCRKRTSHWSPLRPTTGSG